MKVAIIHDWLYVYGGAERVLSAMLRCFPNADVHCLFDILSDADKARIGYSKSKTSFFQSLPLIRRLHRSYLPLMPYAVEQFDLSSYDLVISSSYAVAKGVLTGPDTFHAAYIHSPMRYAWDLQHQYLRESKKDKGIKGIIARMLLHRMRIWDSRTANGPDVMIANSRYIGRRIRKTYGRQSTVIYPPVRIPDIDIAAIRKKDYFLAASRMVQYKNMHVIAEAFANHLTDEQLVIAGDGPDYARIKAIVGTKRNIRMVGFVADNELSTLMSEAKAFIFAAEEDFGIIPVEAQAHGTPVIALGKGGVCETTNVSCNNPTGIFFPEPCVSDIVTAVTTFLATQDRYTAQSCRANALLFSEERFITDFTQFITTQLETFKTDVKNMPQHPATVIME
jgi:glycosyltransferase involved in cell wall biosynthesis